MNPETDDIPDFRPTDTTRRVPISVTDRPPAGFFYLQCPHGTIFLARKAFINSQEGKLRDYCLNKHAKLNPAPLQPRHFPPVPVIHPQ